MDRKLFTLTEGTPLLTDMVAYGNASSAGNITVGNLRTLLAPVQAVKTATMEIGTWNMVTNNQAVVGIMKPNTILESIPLLNIRGIKVIIRNDDESGGAFATVHSDFLSVTNGTSPTGTVMPKIYLYNFNFIFVGVQAMLTRWNGSVYANAAYSKIVGVNGLPFNRGWVTVDYVD